MENIGLFYNPYTESARLIINGKEHRRDGRRIEEFIVGKPIGEWLSPYTVSYHRWNGLLPELMSELNNDEIAITFYSIPAFFSQVQEQLNLQSQLLEGDGYSADLWQCKCVAYFLPEIVASRMAKFITEKKRFVRDQHSLTRFEYCKQKLAENAGDLTEKLGEVYRELCEAVKEAKNYCADSPENKVFENIWINAERELPRIFNRTGQTESTTYEADAPQETI